MIRAVLTSLANGVVRLFAATGRIGEEFSNRELLQHYGYASRPHPGAELVLIAHGNNIVAIADGDRRYTIELENGEASLYDDLGQRVHLTRDGIAVKSALKVAFTTPNLDLTAVDTINGYLTIASHVKVGTGDSGTFRAADGKVITVIDGIIVSIDGD